MVEKILSKIIRGNQAEEATRWSIPSVEQPSPSAASNYNEGLASVCAQIPTERQLEDLKKQAYDEAFQKGLEDGRQHVLSESDNMLSAVKNMLSQLSDPIQFVDEQVREQLVALTLAIAKQIVKKELKQTPEFILQLVDKALAVLPDSPSAIYVHMNPQDAEAIKSKLSEDDKHPGWTVTEDPSIEPGGCKVFTDSTSVDLSLDAQLARIAAKFLDDEGDEDDVAIDEISV